MCTSPQRPARTVGDDPALGVPTSHYAAVQVDVESEEHRAEIAAALETRSGRMDATARRRLLSCLPEPTEALTNP